MSISGEASPATATVRRIGWGPVLLGLSVLAAAILFQDGLRALGAAWATPEYTHGPVIPLLSAYLFLHQLKLYPPQPGPVADRWPGVLLVAASVALAAVGILSGIGDVVAYALILWVGGMILISFGWARGRHFWPGVVHLVFMLPLPGLLHYKVTTQLQLFSSELGVELIRLAGVPVLLDGNIIDLGAYKLAVAEACSGLRYLFPIMSFSYVFATLYRGPTWHKAVLLLAAAPLAVLMNTVRIAMVGVFVDRYGIAHAEGLSHFLEGWVVFITCVVLLFALAWILLRLQRSPLPITEAMDLDLTGLGPQLARLRLVRPSGALAAATLLVGGAALAWAAAPERAAAVPAREPLALFPRELGEWRGAMPQILEPRVRAALGAQDYHWSSFSSADATAPVDLLVVWYADQTEGGIHSPEVCIPGGGWEIMRIEATDIAGEIGAAEPFPINRAVIQQGVTRQLVYFWFDQAGVRTASDYGAKAQLLWNALTLGRSDGALVRMVTPIGPKETEAEAEARLQALLRPALDALPRFVPGA
mgnify:CR=1 FL=1